MAMKCVVAPAQAGAQFSGRCSAGHMVYSGNRAHGLHLFGPNYAAGTFIEHSQWKLSKEHFPAIMIKRFHSYGFALQNLCDIDVLAVPSYEAVLFDLAH